MDPYIDRVELGLFRSGTNALAGLDPDPTYFVNPLDLFHQLRLLRGVGSSKLHHE
jgi:hypothetical protein